MAQGWREFTGTNGILGMRPDEPMTGHMSKRGNEKKTSFELLREAADSVMLPKPPLVVPPPGVVKPVDLWQIVVVGNIDPRQHHPLWYRQIECISEAEQADALKTLIAVVVPSPTGMPQQASLVQFDIGAFVVIAAQDRWTVQTIHEENRHRLLQVASVVFAKLNEISILAFGINKQWSIKPSAVSAKQFVADRLQAAEFGFPAGGTSGQLAYTQDGGDTSTTYQLLPLPADEDWLFVMYNRHHAMPTATGTTLKYFDLGDKIKEFAQTDWDDAAEYGLKIKELVTTTRSEHGNEYP